MVLAMAMKIPRLGAGPRQESVINSLAPNASYLCNLSDAYENPTRTIAATAYGGTVSSCANALAKDSRQ